LGPPQLRVAIPQDKYARAGSTFILPIVSGDFKSIEIFFFRMNSAPQDLSQVVLPVYTQFPCPHQVVTQHQVNNLSSFQVKSPTSSKPKLFSSHLVSMKSAFQALLQSAKQ
jgi:hypothetical protein